MFWMPGETRSPMPDLRRSPWMKILGLWEVSSVVDGCEVSNRCHHVVGAPGYKPGTPLRRWEVERYCCHQSCLLDLRLAPSLYLALAGSSF